MTTKEIRRLKGPTILARPKKPPQEVEKELETSAHDSRAMERERHLHAFEKADAGDPGWNGANGGRRWRWDQFEDDIDDSTTESPQKTSGRGSLFRIEEDAPQRRKNMRRGPSSDAVNSRLEAAAYDDIDEFEDIEGNIGNRIDFDGNFMSNDKRNARGSLKGRGRGGSVGRRERPASGQDMRASKDFRDKREEDRFWRSGQQHGRHQDEEDNYFSSPSASEAQPASAADMEALQERFSQAAASSATPTPSLDEDWEQSWMQQLDAMRAEKGGTSRQ